MINYVKEGNWCMTDCPYNKDIGVASLACRDCVEYISHDKSTLILRCRKQESEELPEELFTL